MIEVFTGTFTGMLGSWAITYCVFTLVQEKALAASVTVVACTIWSLVRNYVVRRYFNRLNATGRLDG